MCPLNPIRPCVHHLLQVRVLDKPLSQAELEREFGSVRDDLNRPVEDTTEARPQPKQQPGHEKGKKDCLLC
jgi:hypothetical protein